MQALLITSAGGLAMLLGFLILGHAAGTYRISALLADPPSGTPLTVGAVLVLAGAFTKSAQVPFHSWLPRAMAAPTPVSAYLHSAAMVKAGIYLLARFSPALAAAGPWRPLVVAVGLSSMVLGGWRALRQYDLKLLLAYGTVSQLGFLTVLAGSGTPEAGAAAAAMLGAHALFKGSLFLTAGVLDHTAGTRDIRHLSGLWRRHRVLLVTAVLACASMAAVPPLAGFVGKEAAYSVYLHGGPGGVVTLTGLVAGSVLTVAYSVRFVGGAFGPPQTELDRLAAAAGKRRDWAWRQCARRARRRSRCRRPPIRSRPGSRPRDCCWRSPAWSSASRPRWPNRWSPPWPDSPVRSRSSTSRCGTG